MTTANDGFRPAENAILARHLATLSGGSSFNSLDEPALLLFAPGKSPVFAQKTITAGAHFFQDDSAATIACKALRVALSALAAKGATPAGISLSLGLHDGWNEAWVAEFAKALFSDCLDHATKLAGADSFISPGGPVVSVTAWGDIRPSEYKSRIGAVAGDRLFVTGTLGDAALGLKVRQGDKEYYRLKGAGSLLSSYVKPRPPVSFAPMIARFASSSMNTSNGFFADLEKMAGSSRISFEVDGRRLPFSAAVREAFGITGAMRIALTGGDDYQFLFTVPAEDLSAFRAAAGGHKVEISEIGLAVEGPPRVAVRHLAGLDLSSNRVDYSIRAGENNQ